MGIYGALSSAVSGLRAQSHALQNISGNIANSQTTGYKRLETSFTDLVSDAPVKNQVPGAVMASSRGTNDLKGDIQNNSTGTFVALSSSGFFVVEPKAGQSGNNAVFTGSNFFTRRGDFELDRDGRLVNGAGYYLKGMPIDPATGNVAGSVPEVLKISNAFLPANKTKTIDYKVNLPLLPKPDAYKADTPDSELLGGMVGSPLGAGDITANDSAIFEKGSIPGGGATVYAENGEPVEVQMRWAKIDNAHGADKWALYYMSDSAASGGATKWTKVGDYGFDASGKLAPGVSAVNITPLTVNGVNVGNVTLRHEANGVTQFADATGQASVSTLHQDGYGAGEFISAAISDGGRVIATYSNGQRIDVAQVATAQFNAPNQLKRLDGGVYSATGESGEPMIELMGNGIVGGALEASNTDISDEFTKLIITQQAYSAGTRIVSSADQMLKEALNMIR